MSGLTRNLRRYVSVALSAFMLAGIFLLIRPENLLERLASFPLEVMAGVLALVLVNQLTVIHRFRRILAHFGFKVSWEPIYHASVLGNLAALVVIPLMGHMLGRQAVLRHAGVSPVENAMIVAYERILVALVSAVLALLGGIYLLGRGLFGQVADVPFIEILLVLGLAWYLNHRLGWRKFEHRHLATVFSRSNTAHVLELLIVTGVSLGAMLFCFALLFHVVAPTLDWLDLFAMAAIVSFGASIPLSFGGWGLREIAAVYVLGLAGIQADAALSASILCGLLSTAGVLLLAAVAVIWRRRVPWGNAADSGYGGDGVSSARVSTENVSAWFLYIATAVLVFFQVHVTIAGTTVNLNLADPFAVLALSAVALDALSNRRWPSWSVPGLNACLLVMGGVLVFGLALAWWLRGSVSGWAVGKVIGWVVLLGYMAAGYMAVHYYGRLGFRRLVEIMVTVMFIVVLCAVFLTPLHGLDLPGFLHGRDTSGLEAYSGNRNALAFQLLVVMALYLPLVGQIHLATGDKWSRGTRLSILVLGVLIGGLFLTASRSALIAFALMAAVGLALRVVDRRYVIYGLLTGVSFWVIAYWLPTIVQALIQLVDHFVVWSSSVLSGTPMRDSSMIVKSMVVIGRVSTEISDHGRLEMLVAALNAWLNHPIFGEGLGAFLLDSKQTLGLSMIIHNTVLWLLAEVGLVGAIPFILTFVLIVRSAWIGRMGAVRSHGVLLIMLMFAVMSQFHEVLYQRIFWIGLGGLAAALPSQLQNRKKFLILNE
ncbi:MAG: flippase-like domain-containing protein [Castellaniella sp.]|nr:flippase-like domain-containing protein [Castellaniella sp.]